MSTLCLNVCILCAKYYDLGANLSKLARLLDKASKFASFSLSGLKGQKLVKADLHEN